MKKKQIIALIACMIVGIAGFTGVYLSEQSNDNQQQENSQVAVEETQQGEEVNQQVALGEEAQGNAQTEGLSSQGTENETNSQVASVENTSQTAEEETLKEQEETVQTSNESTLHFAPEEGLTWPLEGNVLLNYSMDATVYFETLDQYRYNPAMIIGGDVNSKVKLIAKGKITEISENEETGCTVVQDLGDGYEAVYGQLKEVNYEVGDLVEQGQVIGYVSEPTKYYSKEGCNLYFALRKDGEPVDPLEYFE